MHLKENKNENTWFKLTEHGWEMSSLPVQMSPGEEFIVEPLGMKAVKFKYKGKDSNVCNGKERPYYGNSRSFKGGMVMGTEYYLVCDECKVKTYIFRNYSKVERLNANGLAKFFMFHQVNLCLDQTFRIDQDVSMDDDTRDYVDLSKYPKYDEEYDEKHMAQIKSDIALSVERIEERRRREDETPPPWKNVRKKMTPNEILIYNGLAVPGDFQKIGEDDNANNNK